MTNHPATHARHTRSQGEAEQSHTADRVSAGFLVPGHGLWCLFSRSCTLGTWVVGFQTRFIFSTSVFVSSCILEN